MNKLVDCFVLGEGEQTLLEIVQNIHAGKKIADFIGDVAGVMYADELGQPKVTPARERLAGPQRSCSKMHLPPAYRKVRMPLRDGTGNFLKSIEVPSSIGCTQYFSFPSVGKIREMQINYGRGCYKNCKFCSSPAVWGKKVIFRSPKEVVDEIVACYENDGVNFVYFSDLYFNQNLKKLKEICEEMINRKRADGSSYFGGENENNLHWFCLAGAFKARSNKDLKEVEEIIKLMYEAGCVKIGMGIEGFSPEAMIDMKKMSDDPVERAVDVILSFHLASKVGLITRAFFIWGTEKRVSGERAKSLLAMQVPAGIFLDYESLKACVASIYCDEGFVPPTTGELVRLFEIDHLRVAPETPYYSTETGRTRKLRGQEITFKELIDLGEDELTIVSDQDSSLIECGESKESVEHFLKREVVEYFYSTPAYKQSVEKKIKKFPCLKETFLTWKKFLEDALQQNFDWGI